MVEEYDPRKFFLYTHDCEKVRVSETWNPYSHAYQYFKKSKDPDGKTLKGSNGKSIWVRISDAEYKSLLSPRQKLLRYTHDNKKVEIRPIWNNRGTYYWKKSKDVNGETLRGPDGKSIWVRISETEFKDLFIDKKEDDV